MYKQSGMESVGNAPVNALIEVVKRPKAASRHTEVSGSLFGEAHAAIKSGTPQRRRSDKSGEASGMSVLLARAMDEVDYGMVLIDAQGIVCFTNFMARNDLQDGLLLQLEDRRLVASMAVHKDLLENAIARARQGTRSLVDFGFGGGGLTLALVPMAPVSESSPDAVPVLVISGKRSICEQISMQFFAKHHGLSRAEHVVLQALAQGATVQEIADDRGLALSTVRSQIKDIRGKTRCKSVRELLAKVAALPPMVSSLKTPTKA